MTALFSVSLMYSPIEMPLLAAASRTASLSHFGMTISKRSDFMRRTVLRKMLLDNTLLARIILRMIQKSYKFRF